jgi:hypothetical protein
VKTDVNATVSQCILSESAQSATVGYIRIYRTALNNSGVSLHFEYADGSIASYNGMWSFFTGYNNAWVHFTIIIDYSGKTIKFYRNGVLIQTSNMTGTPIFPSTNREKYLGAYNAGSGRITNGNLDDMRIYNRELSASEIKAIYEGTK